jgi:hypothetical protein
VSGKDFEGLISSAETIIDKPLPYFYSCNMKSFFRFLTLVVIVAAHSLVVSASDVAGVQRRRVFDVEVSGGALLSSQNVRSRQVSQKLNADLFLAENEELMLRDLTYRHAGSMPVSVVLLLLLYLKSLQCCLSMLWSDVPAASTHYFVCLCACLCYREG